MNFEWWLSWIFLILFIFFFFFFSFSVWKVGSEEFSTKDNKPKIKDLECRLWSHAKLGGHVQTKSYSCAASWYNKSTVVVNDNNGGIDLVTHDFEYTRDQ
jgi:hypothetical protein